MANTVEQCLSLAAAARAAAAFETLDNVRQIRLRAAESWEILAHRAPNVADAYAPAGYAPAERADRRAVGAKRGRGVPFECRGDEDRQVVAPATADVAEPGAMSPDDEAPVTAQAQPISSRTLTDADLTSAATDDLVRATGFVAADGNVRPLAAIEGDVIRLALTLYGGRMSEVARRLGIGRSTLYRKLAALGIDCAADATRS